MNRLRQILIAASAFLIFGLAASAQQAPPTKSQPAKPKAKRVWTNDDVGTLRKPVDDYQDEKSKQAEEAAKAKEKAAAGAAVTDAAKEKPASPEDTWLPKTLEEAEKRIAEKREEIQFANEYIETLRNDVASADSDVTRAARQKKLDEAIASLDEANAELKQLEGRLQELKSKSPAPSKSAAPKP